MLAAILQSIGRIAVGLCAAFARHSILRHIFACCSNCLLYYRLIGETQPMSLADCHIRHERARNA